MAKTYEMAGVIEAIGKTQEVGQNGFLKRDLIVGNDIDDPSKYPNPRKVTFRKDSCSWLDKYKVGQRVKVVFAVNGRRWDGPKGTQYFVDLVGLKIEKFGDEPVIDLVPPTPPSEHELVSYDEAGDMPF